ncbi:MAG: hypothetical protein ACE5FE_05905 [Acidiferrobacterales bacterium]
MSSDTCKAVGRWIVVMTVTLAFFYGLDQFLMGVQGLPLDWNMMPGR